MMRTFATLIVFMTCFLSHTNSAFSEDKLFIMTEEFPPFNYTVDGKLEGIAVEIVSAIQARLGLPKTIKVYPWARGYNYLQKKKNAVLFTTARNKRRESEFKWVGPIAESRIGLHSLTRKDFNIPSMEDARRYSISVERNSNPMDILVGMNFTNLNPSSDPIKNLKKLLGERNDLWFTNTAVASRTLKQVGKKESEISLVYEFKTTHQFIAFNKNVPDSMIARWQDVYEEMVRDGLVWQMFKKHSLTSLYPRALEKLYPRSP
ncbi:putative Amino acid abc transporter substrate-binding protein [Candidatus Terasakiella magnetica]|uniref:Putative Amino acid abc transporter substrate-binding protein n=1 Tax=Candidatus Terasakiella magnetica TaxID=1867952 RepID=A0A1C3RF51_9PROT|nr:transporter substrate-binding domain-containing protein [Candidatus Terasakiella magnetica]SCA55888.1 putative Amino acid abc transporter substrate-binding protein [Candidatus Terasakiella magnetica]